jgi:trimeric autotransporter adhesin
MNRSIFASTLACLVVSSILTGCGGSSSGSSGTTTTPTATAPTVTSISPTSVTAGSGQLSLTVNGTGFLSSTTVQVGTVVEPTTYVSSTQVTATVSAQQVANGGQFAVIALNGAASSGSGTPVNLQVNNPAPTIASLSPATLLAGTTWLQVAVTGTGFVPSTTVAVNGSARATTYTSATQVNVGLSAADVASSGTLSFTATNSTPGGGTSAASTIAVSNPVPGVGIPSTRTVLSNAATPPAITITGANYVPNTTVLLNGTARATTYVNPTQISFQLTAADIATAQSFTITIQNPAPGGGFVDCGYVYILAATPTPVITQVAPTQIIAGSGPIGLYVYGSNLYQMVGANRYVITSTVLWNGTPLTGTASFGVGTNPYVFITVPANLLTTKGTATVSVSSITSTPAVSNSLAVNIIDPPPPTLTSISPTAVPVNTATTVSLYGTGFNSSSTVALNGTTISSTYGNSTSLTATIPASSLTVPGDYSLTVTTPAPGGGTTAPLNLTAYIGIANNSMVYNPINGLFYVSVPSSAGAPYGNSIVSVDPLTGALGTPIQVGSEPNRLAITADGQYLWVALDGASAVRQVNLTTGVAGQQFSLAGNKGIYATPPTVNALAAVPGANNSVLVAANGILGIYDSGVLRGTATSFSAYSLAVNTTTSEVYAAGSGSYAVYTIAAGGLVQKGTASNGNYGSYSNDDLTVAGGRAYTDYGTVYDAESGALLGTFYATGTTAAQGPVAVDTTLGTAFILDNPQGYASSYGYSQIQTFNTSTYTNASASVIPVSVSSGSSPSTSPSHLTRWGANGLAFRTAVGVYSLRSNLVEDLSSVSADLGVALAQSGGATTGTQTTYTATITNAGPSPSTGVIFKAQIPATAALVSITPSSGACSTTAGIICNLGGLANAASATVTLVVMQTTAGNVVAAAQVTGPENDPASTNNQATASLAVTGSTYNLPPALTAISPAAIASGSGDTTITLTGTGFTSASTVQLGTTALVTGFTSITTLTATVPSAQLASLGWAPITVSNPTPGGGTSAPVPLTIYQILTAGVNHILYEPFSRKIYASVGSGSSSVTGNSIAAITPETGTFGTPVYVGSQPTKMAISDDGNILYSLLGGANNVAMFNLQTQTTQFTFSPPFTNLGSSSTGFRDVAVQTGSENTIALDFGYTSGMAIIDVDPTAKTSALRGTGTSLYTGTSLHFYDPQTLFLFNTDTWNTLDKYGVTASGLASHSPSSSSTLLHFGTFELRGNLAFADAGGLADISTTPATQIGYYPSISGYTYGQQVAPDTSIGAVFFLTSTSASSYSNTPDGLIAYNQATFLPQSVLPINMAAIEGNTSFTGIDLIRWGQDGLAALTSSGHIYLVRGPFVVPQLLNQNSAATLTSSSISTITHGVGNTLLTLTGSNFLPGVAVTWNGSYRTTTVVDTTHVTVAIPASDLAAAGSASLVATNPGATASSTLTITIN